MPLMIEQVLLASMADQAIYLRGQAYAIRVPLEVGVPQKGFGHIVKCATIL
jgi:hypothetical protein